MEPADLVSFHLRVDVSIKSILKDGKIDKSKDTKGYGGIFTVIKNEK